MRRVGCFRSYFPIAPRPMTHKSFARPTIVLLAAAAFAACHSSGAPTTTASAPTPATSAPAAASAAARPSAAMAMPAGVTAAHDRHRRFDLPRQRRASTVTAPTRRAPRTVPISRRRSTFRSTAATTISSASSPTASPPTRSRTSRTQFAMRAAWRTGRRCSPTTRSRRSRRTSTR